jgi:hypothetical protein
VAVPDAMVPPRFGRKDWPPSPGSGYDAYLEWAAEGAWPMEEDVDLATGLWAGMVPHPGPAPQEKEDDASPVGPGR